jgi:uncharacterized membrane protein YqjE
MDDQTKVNGGQVNGSAEGVVESIAEFSNDVASLAELQLKLATQDFKEATARALLPLSLFGVGLVVLLGSVPVAIGGIALLVAQLFSISIGWALFLTALVMMILNGALVVFAGRRLMASLASFRRSREELIRNINWIRTVLVYSGRSVPRRRW